MRFSAFQPSDTLLYCLVLTVFDTDSLDFGVDNICSACISNVREHFVGEGNWVTFGTECLIFHGGRDGTGGLSSFQQF